MTAIDTITRKQDLRNIKQLAAAIGIQYHTLYYRVTKAGEVPRPQIKWGKGWYYDLDTFNQLVARLK